VDEIFLQEFGKKPEEMLREIEPEPIAAASLAQVLKMYTECVFLDYNITTIRYGIFIKSYFSLY
jgi:hypothetical protein